MEHGRTRSLWASSEDEGRSQCPRGTRSEAASQCGPAPELRIRTAAMANQLPIRRKVRMAGLKPALPMPGGPPKGGHCVLS